MNCLEITNSIRAPQLTRDKSIKSSHIQSAPIEPIESIPPIPRRIFLTSEENEILICPSLKEIYNTIFSSE